MLKVYVAGAVRERMERAIPAIAQLRAAGVEITLDWTTDIDANANAASSESEVPDDIRLRAANDNISGVQRADFVLFLAPDERGASGAWTEFGVALASKIPVVVTGQKARRTIFTSKAFRVFATDAEGIAFLIAALRLSDGPTEEPNLDCSGFGPLPNVPHDGGYGGYARRPNEAPAEEWTTNDDLNADEHNGSPVIPFVAKRAVPAPEAYAPCGACGAGGSTPRGVYHIATRTACDDGAACLARQRAPRTQEAKSAASLPPLFHIMRSEDRGYGYTTFATAKTLAEAEALQKAEEARQYRMFCIRVDVAAAEAWRAELDTRTDKVMCNDRIEDAKDPDVPNMPYVCTLPEGHAGEIHEHREEGETEVLARWVVHEGVRRFATIVFADELMKLTHPAPALDYPTITPRELSDYCNTHHGFALDRDEAEDIIAFVRDSRTNSPSRDRL